MRSSLAEVVRTLEAKRQGDGFMARCPAHEDRNPSLSVTESNGKLLFNCHAGCRYEEIRAALETKGIDLREDGPVERQETVWRICTSDGRSVAQHVRIDAPGGKRVFWRGPNEEPVRLADMGYRLRDLPLYGTELLEGCPQETVIITEGEKAADYARRLGLLALGTSTGAGACPSPEAMAPLKGRKVVLWPDNDDDGRRHMGLVKAALKDIAASVAVLTWKDAPPKGDAADFVQAGLKLADFEALLSERRKTAGLRYLHEAAQEALAELDRFAAGDTSRYVSTGIGDLDRKLGGGLRRGTVTLIGAPTGAGKTTILGGFALAAADRGAALIISPEMSLAELAEREIVRRAEASKWSRERWADSAERARATQAHQSAADELWTQRPKVLVFDRSAVTMDEVLEATEEAKALHPELSMVVIDYAQEVADTDPRTPRYLTVGAVAQRSVTLARRHDVAVVIASQVNTVKDAGSNGLAFRESAILEHKASNVLLFLVEWSTDPVSGGRSVKKAAFKATKCRAGGLFDLEVEYQPALYRVSNAVPVAEAWHGGLR